jgi:hypothetical protein
MVSKLGQDSFLPNPFYVIIHYHRTIRRYIVRATDAKIKQNTKINNGT